MKKSNLVKSVLWMAAAFVCLMIIALISAGVVAYDVLSALCFICMAVSMVYWVRFAMPLAGNAFKFR